MSLDTILTKYRGAARDNRDLGDRFERLIERYLLADPQYANRLSDVWLWAEWPDRPGADVGIDLVARERDTGVYWAIQCKFYGPSTTLSRRHVDSFFTASGQSFTVDGQEHHFAHRLVVSTTDRWGPNVESAIRDQLIPVGRLTLHDLAESPVDWSRLDDDGRGTLGVRAPNTPRDHQKEAIAASIAGFATSDRGRLIMACGTGKTFTSLKLAEAQVPADGSILFLAPSIALVAQTLREWTAQAEAPFTAFVVCSDSSVGRGGEDLDTHEFAFPATTDPRRLAQDAGTAAAGRRTVVFSTYQSISVVGEAQAFGLPRFDLIVCDEAHRTTGVTLAGAETSEFVKVHDDGLVGGERRLYMTATPRIFGEATRGRVAAELDRAWATGAEAAAQRLEATAAAEREKVDALGSELAEARARSTREAQRADESTRELRELSARCAGLDVSVREERARSARLDDEIAVLRRREPELERLGALLGAVQAQLGNTPATSSE